MVVCCGFISANFSTEDSLASKARLDKDVMIEIPDFSLARTQKNSLAKCNAKSFTFPAFDIKRPCSTSNSPLTTFVMHRKKRM